jgi:hypothetical protein
MKLVWIVQDLQWGKLEEKVIATVSRPNQGL